LCRSILMEWTGDRGETKRIQMAERILEHQGLSVSGPGSIMSSGSSSPSGPKGRKQSISILGLGKSKKHKEELVPTLSPKVATEVDVARKILQSTVAKQQKLKV